MVTVCWLYKRQLSCTSINRNKTKANQQKRMRLIDRTDKSDESGARDTYFPNWSLVSITAGLCILNHKGHTLMIKYMKEKKKTRVTSSDIYILYSNENSNKVHNNNTKWNFKCKREEARLMITYMYVANSIPISWSVEAWATHSTSI